MTKRIPGAKRGRPPVNRDTMDKKTMIRMLPEEYAAYEREVERLERVTGQQWSVAGYMRLAARQMLGKHLAGMGEG